MAAASVAATVATGAVGRDHVERRGGFAIQGHVAGLYPGARRRLVLVVTNRSRRRLAVRSIVTSVRDASRGCQARNLHVSPFHGTLRVAPRASVRVALVVRMLPTSPRACEGARFPLHFRGQATR